ncbi:MAG: tRNA 2-selenouridine(34) synthase MnmH [Pseudomonadota bacterium]
MSRAENPHRVSWTDLQAARAAHPGQTPSPEIIDVRSPAEFAEDHIPGALNLAVLSDAERAQVGALYVRESRFLARKTGAALVSRNIARHLEDALRDKPGDYAPIVHCWRGGQRSQSLALVMAQIGWRVGVLAGGYQAYRRHVNARLYGDAPWFRIVLLDGPTGVGKTAVLRRLAARGAATLDLEDLAAHRGSIFGAEPTRPQPSQKMFETNILHRIETALAAAPSGAPLILEAESNKIGARQIPPVLWRAMRAAPRIVLSAPVEARARHCLEEYAALAADASQLDALLGRLTILVGREQVAAWRALASAGAHLRLAEELMGRHYDPAYARSGRRAGAGDGRARATLGEVEMLDLNAAELERAAGDILHLANSAEATATPRGPEAQTPEAPGETPSRPPSSRSASA